MPITLSKENAAILFADINGYVRLCQGVSTAKVAEFLHDFYVTCARAVEDEGGYIERFMGDAVLATFNIPEPVEGAGRRAIAAARQLQNMVQALPHAAKFNITLGCGVNMGPVVCGELGIGASKNWTVLGKTVNIAAHLCHRANKDFPQTGAVLLSESVAHIMADNAITEVDPLQTGNTELKAYRLL